MRLMMQPLRSFIVLCSVLLYLQVHIYECASSRLHVVRVRWKRCCTYKVRMLTLSSLQTELLPRNLISSPIRSNLMVMNFIDLIPQYNRTTNAQALAYTPNTHTQYKRIDLPNFLPTRWSNVVVCASFCLRSAHLKTNLTFLNQFLGACTNLHREMVNV